jgi:hypothetical protein
MRTIFVLFGGYSEARGAVEQLAAREFDTDAMNVVVLQSACGGTNGGCECLRDDAPDSGRSFGEGLDHLLAGRSMTMPDVGVVLVGGGISPPGDIAPAGLEEMLASLAVPREVAEYYADGVRDGGLLMWVRTGDDRAEEAVAILSGKG